MFRYPSEALILNLKIYLLILLYSFTLAAADVRIRVRPAVVRVRRPESAIRTVVQVRTKIDTATE